METTHHGREDRPINSNPDEVHFTEPGKEFKAQHKIDIKQSELGREQGQSPADEHIENRFSQIDDQTKDLYQQIQQKADNKPGDRASSSAGYMNDETSADRDTGNSHGDQWEESRTSRHK